MKTAYKNLAAEMARSGVAVSDIAEALGCTTQNVYLKMKGGTNFTVSDCQKIAGMISEKTGKAVTIDYLFEE